jgi:hypothetical protein
MALVLVPFVGQLVIEAVELSIELVVRNDTSAPFAWTLGARVTAASTLAAAPMNLIKVFIVYKFSILILV